MKHKTVSTIAAILCGIFALFTATPATSAEIIEHPYWMTAENTKGIPEVILQGYLYRKNKTRKALEKQNGSRSEEEERRINDVWSGNLLELSQYLAEHPEEQRKLAEHYKKIRIDEIDWGNPPDPPWVNEIIRKEMDPANLKVNIELYYDSPEWTKGAAERNALGVFGRAFFPDQPAPVEGPDFGIGFGGGNGNHPADRFELLKLIAQEKENPHQFDGFFNARNWVRYWEQPYGVTRNTCVIDREFERNVMLVLSRTAPIAEPQKQWNAPVLSRSLRDDDHYQYYQYTWLNRCKLGVLSMLITVIEDHATGLIYKNDLPRDDMRAALDLFASKLQSGNDDMEAVARLLRMMHWMALCDMPGGAEYEAIGMCRRALTKWAGMKNWYWEKSEELLQHDKNNKDAVLIPHPVKKQDFWPKRDSVQPDEPEVILTLEGTLNASGKFVFTGDTIRYDAPGEHQAPSDVTIDGKPWKDLNQPFKLDFTPDFENVIIADRAGGNGVMLNRGSVRAELTLFIVDAHAPAPHFVVRLVVKNVSSSRTEPARLNPSELPSGPIPFQQQLQMALERRAVLEKTIRNLELVPDFPEESIDEVRRQLRDLDRMIELLKEVVEKAAARDANDPPSPPPAD